MVRAILLLFSLSFLLSACTLTASLISDSKLADSSPDPSTPPGSPSPPPPFGNGGLAVFQAKGMKISGNNDAGAIAVQPDGKILVGGYAETTGSEDFAVIRYKTDGTLDTTFADSGVFSYNFDNDDYDRLAQIALQSDGKIVLAGYSTDAATGDSPLTVLRLQSNGQLDSSFGNNGVVRFYLSTFTDHDASQIAFQSDGRILVGGTVRGAAAQLKIVIARLETNGTVDATFANNNGFALIDASGSNNGIGALKTTSTDQIIIAGNTTGPGSWDTMVARLSADGVLDATFGTGGIYKADRGTGARDSANDALVLPDGSIMVTGYHDTTGYYTPNVYLLKLTALGVPDTTFNGTGFVSTDTGSNDESSRNIYSITGGYLVTGFDGGKALTLKYTSAGVLDTSFNGTGYVKTDPTGFYDSINGSVYFNGEVYYVGYVYDSSEDYLTFKLKADGTLDSTFNGTGFVITDILTDRYIDTIDSVGLSNGMTLAITELYGKGDVLLGITRLSADGSVDLTYGNQGTLVVGTVGVQTFDILKVLPLASGKTLIAGSLDDDALLIRLASDGQLDTSFNGTGLVTNIKGGTSEKIYDVIELANGSYMAVGNSAGDISLFKFTNTGTVDTSFGSSGISTLVMAGTDYGNSISQISDGKFIVGGTLSAKASVLRFNSDGSLDTSFATVGYVQHRFNGTSADMVTGLKLAPDGGYLVAGTTFFSADYDIFLMKVLPDGTLDTSFGTAGKAAFDLEPGKFDTLGDFEVLASGKILAVGDIKRSSLRNSLLIRFNSDGSLDSSFATGGVKEFDLLPSITSDYPRALRLDSNSNIFVTCETLFQLGPSAIVKFDAEGNMIP